VLRDRALDRHAAAETRPSDWLKSSDSKPGVCSSALNSVLTPLKNVNGCLRSTATNAAVARVRDQQVVAPMPMKNSVCRERKDVIERQRADDRRDDRASSSAGPNQASAA
jgi:hypothetical protein